MPPDRNVAERGRGREFLDAIVERPVRTAFLGTVGALIALVLLRAAAVVASALVLIGLAFFLAIGIDPVIRFLGRRKLSRRLATAVVLTGLLVLIGGFLAAAAAAIVTEAERFSTQLPHYEDQLRRHQGLLGRLDQRYHLLDSARTAVSSGFGREHGLTLLHVGQAALGGLAATLIVLVLLAYFLSDLPRITRGLLRLVPSARRPRVGLLAEAVFARVGGFVLGNIASSVIAGLGTFVWLEIFRVPFATLLSAFVALIDLVPVVGSTIGGAVVTLVSLTVSLPVAIATLIFYVVYRLLEDYLINPRIFGKTVDVPPMVTVVAVLFGGALGGVLGALVAIPAAASVRILLEEVAYPYLDQA